MCALKQPVILVIVFPPLQKPKCYFQRDLSAHSPLQQENNLFPLNLSTVGKRYCFLHAAD